MLVSGGNRVHVVCQERSRTWSRACSTPLAMLKLTRLNNQVVVVNPDLVYAVDATPDTTLRLVGGERILVRESLDELITKVVEFRHRVQRGDAAPPRTAMEADKECVAALTLRQGADEREALLSTAGGAASLAMAALAALAAKEGA